MKKKIKEEIKVKSSKELIKIVKDSENLIFKLRLEKSQNKLKNLRQIFNERKKIALMETLITEKQRLEKLAKEKELNETKRGN